jgi:hypothetical protein
MYLNQNLNYLEYLGTGKKSGMLAQRAAASLFDRALSQGLRRRWLNKITGHSNSLPTLEHRPIVKATNSRERIINVPLDQIVGSESRSGDFDRYFNPLRVHNRDRWIGIAIAFRAGVALPPVELIQEGDHFYVRDGHHRISVARSIGQKEVEARIVN